MAENMLRKILKSQSTMHSLFSKINYYFGVPGRYLNKRRIKNYKDLERVIEKYSTKPTEFEKDLEIEFSGITNW